LTIARFRLLAPHDLMTPLGPAQFDAGTEIESSAHPGFAATAHMEPLDAEADAMLATECDRLRRIADSHIASSERASVIGFGPTQTLPA